MNVQCMQSPLTTNENGTHISDLSTRVKYSTHVNYCSLSAYLQPWLFFTDIFMALCIINLNHSCSYFLTATSMESWVAMKNLVGLKPGSLHQYPVFILRLDFHNSKCIFTHFTWAKIVHIILLQTPFHM
jgi:hypothetical protein